MADGTSIEWADASWNPLRGCSMAHGSETGGCLNCYAAREAVRHSGPGGSYEGLARMTRSGPRWSGEVRFIPENLCDPLHWRKPRRIFVNSMSDYFHESVPFETLDRLFGVMALCPQHRFLILTKRPARMIEYFLMRGGSPPPAGSAAEITPALVYREASRVFNEWGSANPNCCGPAKVCRGWPLPNVWLGVSCEDQATADERIPLLLRTPAAVWWVSYEPALGPVDWDPQWFGGVGCPSGLSWPARQMLPLRRPQIDWLVCGGESGPGARPMHPDWARGARDQCQAAGVPFFMKQWGAFTNEVHPEAPGEWVSLSGLRSQAGPHPEADDLPDWVSMARLGKHRAGRLLDGVLHDAYPEVSA